MSTSHFELIVQTCAESPGSKTPCDSGTPGALEFSQTSLPLNVPQKWRKNRRKALKRRPPPNHDLSDVDHGTCRCATTGCCWLLVVGCWLLVVGCWLLVVGCWLLVVGCWLLVVGCWLLVVGCWLLVVGCLLFVVVVCCLLFVVCCLLFVVCCLLFVVCCLLFVVCCLLFVVCCLLFVVCCLLFVVCCCCFRHVFNRVYVHHCECDATVAETN